MNLADRIPHWRRLAKNHGAFSTMLSSADVEEIADLLAENDALKQAIRDYLPYIHNHHWPKKQFADRFRELVGLPKRIL